jgi:hypothetical protein
MAALWGEKEREKKEKKPTKPNVRTNICSDPLLVFPPFPPTGLRYSAVETSDPIRESPVDGHPLDVVDRGFLARCDLEPYLALPWT